MLDKAQALLFHEARNASPRHLVIGGAYIKMEAIGLRYLGIVMDGRWCFRARFVKLGSQLLTAAGSLSRLFPHFGGHYAVVYRLYKGVADSKRQCFILFLIIMA